MKSLYLKVCAAVRERMTLFSPLMPILVVVGKDRRILHVTQEYFGYQSNRHIFLQQDKLQNMVMLPIIK